MRIRGVVVAVVGAAAVVMLAGCGGSGSGPAVCTPANAKLVSSIRDTLAVYPEIGETLADGAQAVGIGQPYNNGAAEYRVLIAGRLQPSGQVGLWAAAYNDTNDAFLGAQPINAAAMASMPDAVATEGDAAALRQQIESSEVGKAAIACVK